MILENKLLENVGTSWNRATSDSSVASIVLSTGRIIIALANGGCAYSDDNGEHYTGSASLTTREFTCFCKTESGTLFAGLAPTGTSSSSHGSVAKSTNNGQTWTIVSGNVILTTVSGIAYTESNHTLYVTGKSNFANVEYSTDSGANWTGANWSSASETIYRLLFTTNGYLVFVTNVGIYLKTNMSTTAAKKYTFASGEATVDNVSICQTSTGKLLVGTASAIYTSTDEGNNWIGNTTIGAACFAQAGVNKVYAIYNVTGSIGGIYLSKDDGVSWSKVNRHIGRTIQYMFASLSSDERLVAGLTGVGTCYSDPVVGTYETKYLNKTSVQELVTQFKAYVQSKK